MQKATQKVARGGIGKGDTKIKPLRAEAIKKYLGQVQGLSQQQQEQISQQIQQEEARAIDQESIDTQLIGDQTYKRQKISADDITSSLADQKAYIKAATTIALQAVPQDQQNKTKIQILQRLVAGKNRQQADYEQSSFGDYLDGVAKKTGLDVIKVISEKIDAQLKEALDKFIQVRIRQDGTRGQPIARRMKFTQVFNADSVGNRAIYRKARSIIRQLKNLIGLDNVVRNGVNSTQVIERATLSNRATQSNPASIFNRLFKSMTKTGKTTVAGVIVETNKNITAGLKRAGDVIQAKVRNSLTRAEENNEADRIQYINAKDQYRLKYGNGIVISEQDAAKLADY